MKYRVHGFSAAPVQVDGTLPGGIAFSGTTPGVTVELVPLDAWGKSITMVELTPTDETAAAARAKYQPGAVLDLVLNPSEA